MNEIRIAVQGWTIETVKVSVRYSLYAARIAIARVRVMRSEAAGRPLFLRFGVREQIIFAKRLGMLLRAGIPILESLYMLRDQMATRSGQYILDRLIAHVSRGQPLSRGLAQFTHIFGEFCINIVRVGETSGTLHENLNYLAEELKKKHALRKKVAGALVYPAIIVTATLGISLVLTMYIFPKITPIFASFKTELPLTTRILIAASNFLLAYGLWLILGLIVFAIGFYYLLRIERVHLAMDHVLIRMPLFGSLSQFYNLANISRTLGLLLKSDVPVVYSFEIVSRSVRNRAYRRELEAVGAEIAKGQRISTQFEKRAALFPSLFTQMTAVGEQTGNLPGSLIFVSEMYDEEIDALTKNLTTMLEPILMLVMGVIAILAAIVIVAINPARQFAQARNSQRQSNINSILNAIGQNLADNKGVFKCDSPSIGTSIDTADRAIGTGTVNLNCLVPTYIPNGIPMDPEGGTEANTGYTVSVDSVGRYTVCAPNADEAAIPDSDEICVTR